MKTILLFCFTLLTLNFSEGATHIITWGVPSHGNTNIFVGDTVQWNFVGFHDVTSSGSPSFASSSAQSGGSYSVTFNSVGDYYYFCSVHGAGSMDGTIVVSEILGVEDLETKSNFLIYPNPSKNVLNLETHESIKTVLIEVYDVTGKNIYKSKMIEPKSIDVVNWKAGLYFVRVSSDNYNITKRFVKH